MGIEARAREATRAVVRRALVAAVNAAPSRARHEAAHVVAAHELGIRVLGVDLRAADLEWGAAVPFDRAQVAAAGLLSTKFEMEHVAREHGAKNAGWRFSADPQQDDTRFVFWCSRAAGDGDPDHARKVGERAMQSAAAILQARLQAWRALAEALEELGRLDAAQVELLLGPMPAHGPGATRTVLQAR